MQSSQVNTKLIEFLDDLPWGRFNRYIVDEVRDFKTAERILRLMIPLIKDDEKLKRFYQRYSRLRFPYERELLEKRKWHTT